MTGSEGVAKKTKGPQHQALRFKTAMIWEKEVSDFVRSRVRGLSLNIPCGMSEIGDVRIDQNPESKAQRFQDFFDYMKMCDDNTFDTVISDPPWKIQYYHRARWFFACVDKCKVGGRIIYNATWIPTSKCVELEELWVRQSTTFANVSVLSVFKKLQTSEGMGRPYEKEISA